MLVREKHTGRVGKLIGQTVETIYIEFEGSGTWPISYDRFDKQYEVVEDEEIYKQ